MSEESLGVLFLGALIGSPLLVGVGCGILAVDATINLPGANKETVESTSNSLSAPAAATGGASAVAVAGAIGAGSLLLSSGIFGGLALSMGATCYAACEAYNSEKGYMATAADLLTPTNYMHRPSEDADPQSMSEQYKTYKGYVKAALAFITLPALLLGTLLGLTAKFISDLFPKETNELKQEIHAAAQTTMAN